MPATRTVGAYEAKTTLSALLELVLQGREIVITRHERPVARLVPVELVANTAAVMKRVCALRGRLALAKGETARGLVAAGRRI